MMRRATWFLAGAVTALWARRRALETADRFMPASVWRQASARARGLGRDLRSAVDDGRDAMRSRADGLRGLPSRPDPTVGPSANGHPVGPYRPTPGRGGRSPSVG